MLYRKYFSNIAEILFLFLEGEMKKSNILLFLAVCIFSLFFATGCGNKTALTVDQFKSISEKAGYKVEEVKDFQLKDVQSVTLAKGKDYQVEFYQTNDNSSAVYLYNINRDMFEKSKKNISSESSVSIGNYAKYTLSSNGDYMVASQIDNTFVYAKVKEENKEKVKSLLKELGY